MSLIKGIHHVSMKCSSTEEYEKTIDFYKNILGIPVAREWQAGIMLDTGNGIVEIFNDGDDGAFSSEQGDFEKAQRQAWPQLDTF